MLPAAPLICAPTVGPAALPRCSRQRPRHVRILGSGERECLGSSEASGYLEAAVAYAKSAGAGSNAPTLILDGQRVPGGAAGLARYGALLLGTDSSTQAKR